MAFQPKTDLIVTGSLSTGATPAQSGTIRLSNADSIVARNASNNADLNLFKFNASDQWEIGDATMPEIITRTRLEIEDQLHVRQSGTTVFSVAPATGGEIVTVDTTGTPRLEITGRIVVRGDTSVIGSSSIEIETVRAEVSTASGSSVTAVGLIPAGVLLLGVTTRVRTPVTGPSGYDVGDGTDVDRWGNSIGTASSTPSDVTDYTSTALTYFPTAGDVVITSDGVDFTGGTIAVAVQYIRPTAPIN